MSFKINANVTWVGKTDWELRKFHGEEYSTLKGSTYNSYLVRDEKTVLIDTVWQPFAKEFVQKLKQEIDLDKIDYIVSNHAEVDHSGALPELMREIPDTPIYCSANAVKSLKGHYHKDWNFVAVKTGDKLSLGKKSLVFVEAKMLHWPDSMFCYLTGDNILFSNDAFGQHYCSEYMYNDLVDQAELFNEALKYYANILTPFSKFVTQKINEVAGFNLPLDMICPSHGVIWRNNPMQIVNKYAEWAHDYQEDQVTIIYDTMWDSTRKMAEAIAQGIRTSNGKINVKLFNSARSDNTEIIAEVFKSKAILIGSPTVNRGVLSSTAAILDRIRGLGFKGKKAAAFGSYGWSGESPKIIREILEQSGFEILSAGAEAISDGIKELWVPDEEAIKRCNEFGSGIGVELQG